MHYNLHFWWASILYNLQINIIFNDFIFYNLFDEVFSYKILFFSILIKQV